MNSFFNRMILLSLLFSGGCKKDKIEADNVATLNIVNGIVQKNVLVKLNGSINNSGANSSDGRQSTIYFGSNLFFYMNSQNTSIDFLNRTDSLSLVSKNFDLKKGGIYTVLLAGIAPNADAVIIDDSNIPFVNQSVMPSEEDSVINIRFVNLSPDLQPVNIRLQGSTTNEVNALAFKGYSGFKSYPGKITTYSGTLGYSVLNFEIIENGVVIKTQSVFVYTPNRFKTIALVLTGMKTPVPGSGQPALAVNTINYFQ